MRQLVDGKWVYEDESFAGKDGKFDRPDTDFRNWITPDGSKGPNGQKGFKAEKNRYHLYVSYACPWAHRTLIFRHLKELEDIISFDVVHPHMLEKSWTFDTDFPKATGDTLYNSNYLYEIYQKAAPDMTGKVTVPVLWDKKEETIVNNESADIIRIFNTAFDDITGNTDNFYPDDLKSEIDDINKRVYDKVNNGVYKTGFATKQEVYTKEVKSLFETLDWLEQLLGDGREYSLGEQLTEADIRLFTTLVRFDAVYHGHFKCNINRISDYKWLQRYIERIYDLEAVKQTVNLNHIKEHYYYSHGNINPTRIVPEGPLLTWYDSQ
ncbi:MAG: glutathione-dependent reductase [Alphaproteobacteria bacterium]|nr:glutathione-dependent reductase [Alphaproteobacteria bacterium]